MNSSSPYLIAKEGMWISDKEEIRFDEMTIEHKCNCLRFLEKEKENIMDGGFIAGVKFEKEQHRQEIIQKAKELYTHKMIELKVAIAKELQK